VTLSIDAEFRRDRLAMWIVAVLLMVTFLYVVWRYVGTVMLGLFAYYVTRPLFDRIYARVDNRTLAVAVSIFTVALPVLVLGGWTAVVAIQGLLDMLSSTGLEQVRDLIEPYVDLSAVQGELLTVGEEVLEDPRQLATIGGNGIGGAFATVLGTVALLFNVFLRLFIVLVIAFYLLKDDYRVASWARDTFAARGSVVERYFEAVDRDLKNVYFGNILNAMVTGLLGAVVYIALNAVAPANVGVPEPLLLGLLTGAASLIPVIGMKLVWVPIALLLLVDSLVTDPSTVWFPLLFAAVSTVVIDYIPDQLLRPYVSGRSLHVGAIMLAYIVGPLLFGWYGLFLGPLVLVVIWEFARIVVPWLAHPEREARPVTRPDEAPARARSGVGRAIPSGMLSSGDRRESRAADETTD
jgi:predicted PurR-regulated permease PerM